MQKSIILRIDKSKWQKSCYPYMLWTTHITDCLYNQYENLNKGILCGSCGSFNTLISKRLFIVCNKCGKKERLESALLLCLEEFRLLFPNEKLTTKKLLDWCKIISSDKQVRRVLVENFEHVGWGKSSYFVKKQ